MNMKKEVRKELRELRKKFHADDRAIEGDIKMQLKIFAIARSAVSKLRRLQEKQKIKTSRRIAILEGRLT